MNTELDQLPRRVLLLEFGGAPGSGWAAALARNQFDVHTIPDGADPLFATALLQAAGTQPSLMIATLGYFAGRNRNPYQFNRQFGRMFPETVIVLVQPPGQEVTEALRATARRYGAADLVTALPEGDAADALIEMLWFSACAQGAREVSGEAPALPIAQQVAAQLRRQLGGRGISTTGGRSQGAFRASDALALAEKFSVSTAQLTQWLDGLMQQGALRALAGEKSFVAGDGLYRFFTDEPASKIAAGSVVALPAAAHAAGTPATRAAADASRPTGNRQPVNEIDVHAVANAMCSSAEPLEIRDRSYRLTKYPKCFIGSEAVDWLVRHHALSRPQAVRLGERMFESGLFHHVADDHDFKDGNFYFRFFADEAPIAGPPGKARGLDIDTLDAKDAATRMRGAGGVEVATRRYLLKSYPKCFIGTEAVDWIAATYRLSRPLAVKLGERMVEAGIVHHVADDHDFKDGEFFYRYYADE